MDETEYKIKAKTWLYPGPAAWCFATVPKSTAQKISKTFLGLSRGFGSFPVLVTIGATSWKTSIFPDSKTKTFLLPLKASARKKENIKIGATVSIALKVIV